MRGKNLSGLEVTPAMIHVRHATKIASEVTEGYFICDNLPRLPPPCCVILLRRHQSLSLFTTFFFNLRGVSLSPDSPHHRPLIIIPTSSLLFILRVTSRAVRSFFYLYGLTSGQDKQLDVT